MSSSSAPLPLSVVLEKHKPAVWTAVTPEEAARLKVHVAELSANGGHAAWFTEREPPLDRLTPLHAGYAQAMLSSPSPDMQDQIDEGKKQARIESAAAAAPPLMMLRSQSSNN